jgi:AAA domain
MKPDNIAVLGDRHDRQLLEKIKPEKKSAKPVKLTFFGDLTENPAPKPWLIKNVIARGETSSWFAPPGKGKSALLTDLAVNTAAGINWREYRTIDTAGVVYFALERADLVRRRLIAHRRRDGLGDLPIAVAGQVIDLMDKTCAEVILATLKHAEDRFGIEVGLAIFDTYSKGIAAGGGDEDKARDQNIVLANLRRVLDQVNIHIAGIGHTGKDESRGERGSNARKADVDLQVQISGDIIKTATIIKANDQAEGALTAFKLEAFDFGVDEDGEPNRTFILSDEVYTAQAAGERGLSPKQRLAMEALAEATLSKGRAPPAEYALPIGIKVVTKDEWNTELVRRSVIDKDGKNPRARFAELLVALADKKRIGNRDDLVWSASR